MSSPTPRRPINLGLNDGTYCSQHVIDLLQTFNTTTSLRNYPDPDNSALRDAVAAECGCAPENVYLAAGSGPILKQAMRLIIERNIKASPIRAIKHLLRQPAYPIITPVLTYFKVPLKAEQSNLAVRFLPLRAEDDFRIRSEDLTAALDESDGMVYLPNPNNPTGRLLVDRAQIEPIIARYPRSTFWIDEAYVQYMPPELHQPLVDLVMKYPNVVCSRTFSFAYGLAALKVGYFVAPRSLIDPLEAGVTNYRIPLLCEQLCVAAMEDQQHLDLVRRTCAEARALFAQRLGAYDFLRVHDSHANFSLIEITDGRSAKELCAKVLERGFKLKTFVPVAEHRFDHLFRITVGTPDENAALMDVFDEILGGPTR
ncbi:MAG: histidinol-phosphate aminotransferase family protein [Alphaproteobacteria bacterium]|nr:histidinol-phosphate aminotransferase family protein [Alphaproteobacteria bacterium]